MLINKDKIKKIKRIIIILIISLLILSVLLMICLSKRLEKEIYKSEDRISYITKEQKKDIGKDYKTVGWLRVQGTNIDTPIIVYLKEEGSVNVEKENYVWNPLSDGKFHNKTNIMGHNILNLSATPDSGLKQFSRFDDLMSFVYYDFVKDNKYIEYTIDGKNYIYKIFSINFDKEYNLELHRKDDYSKDELKEYINTVKDNSIYNFNTSVNENDKFISLVTCTRMFATKGDKDMEFVINARLVRKYERLTNYGVKKTKKYKEVEKILKGSENDETNA